jgi:hypothetical protein
MYVVDHGEHFLGRCANMNKTLTHAILLSMAVVDRSLFGRANSPISRMRSDNKCEPEVNDPVAERYSTREKMQLTVEEQATIETLTGKMKKEYVKQLKEKYHG